MTATAATVQRSRFDGVRQIPRREESRSAPPDMGARSAASSAATLAPLDAAWAVLAGTVGGRQSDRWRALDMMCD